MLWEREVVMLVGEMGPSREFYPFGERRSRTMRLPANCEGRSHVPQSFIDDGHFVGQMMVGSKLREGANQGVGKGQASGGSLSMWWLRNR